MRKYNHYAVAIRRRDGSEFIAHSGSGIAPHVYRRSRDPKALQERDGLRAHGLDARIVPVAYTEPMIIQRAKRREKKS